METPTSTSGVVPEPSSQPEGQEIDHQALFVEVAGKPCQVSYVEKVYEKERDGKGAPLRTKSYLIDRELQRVYEANSLEQINLALVEATSALQELDVFKRIDVIITEEPEVSQICNGTAVQC